MKSRENLVRLKQFQVNEKRRQLMQLDMMIAEFDRMAAELEIQIGAEEKKAGITDINHFAYPTFAKAARLRRDNLKNSGHGCGRAGELAARKSRKTISRTPPPRRIAGRRSLCVDRPVRHTVSADQRAVRNCWKDVGGWMSGRHALSGGIAGSASCAGPPGHTRRSRPARTGIPRWSACSAGRLHRG